MNVNKFLDQNVKPATGCTEPIAVAYATALAYSSLYGNSPNNFVGSPVVEFDKIKEIRIRTDRDVYKNALSIAIPATNGQKGMAIASAIGIYSNPEKELNLLQDTPNEVLYLAKKMLEDGKVIIEEVEDKSAHSELDINVTLNYDDQTSLVRLRYEHTNVTDIIVNGNQIYHNDRTSTATTQEKVPNTIDEMLTVVRGLTEQEKNRLYEGVTTNMLMAKEGFENFRGAGYSHGLQELQRNGLMGNSLIDKVKIMAASAGDARMGGVNMPVMSTSGSGNQGITALIPLGVIGQELGISKDKISEGAMLAHLVTKYVSNHSGYLSAICGCAIKAGIGGTAGLVYTLNGNKDAINNAINIMSANITGIVCDGAKEGCALKLSTAAASSAESALLSLNTKLNIPADNGIIHKNAMDTIKGIGKITKSMVPTDVTIVEIMQNKCFD